MQDSGILRLDGVGGFTQTSGTIVIANDTWTRIDVAYDTAAGGIGKVWVENVLDIDITHTGLVNNVASVNVGGLSTNPNWYFFDDMLFWDSATQPPDGMCIVRQGTTGTSIDDAWPTKTGAATAAGCWSDTPPDAATFVSTGNVNTLIAQTMPVHPFSTSQSGHGAVPISPTDTINGVKIGFIGQDSWGESGNTNIRYYVNAGSPTDIDLQATGGTGNAMSIVDHYLERYITETDVANLDLYEIGLYHPAGDFGAHTTIIRDIWMHVDFLSPPESKTLSLNQIVNLSIAVSATIGAAEAVAERYYPLTLVEITTP